MYLSKALSSFSVSIFLTTFLLQQVPVFYSGVLYLHAKRSNRIASSWRPGLEARGRDLLCRSYAVTYRRHPWEAPGAWRWRRGPVLRHDVPAATDQTLPSSEGAASRSSGRSASILCMLYPSPNLIEESNTVFPLPGRNVKRSVVERTTGHRMKTP